MEWVVILLLSTAEPSPGTGITPRPEPLTQRWALTPSPGLGQDLEGSFSLWGDLELSVRVLPWLRVEVSSGAAWVPFPIARYPGAGPRGPARAAFRAVAGADFVVPLRWGLLFAGAAGGLEHTNLLYEVFDTGEDLQDRARFSWITEWCLQARGGVEVRASEHVALGATLNLVYVRNAGPGAELHGRVSFLF